MITDQRVPLAWANRVVHSCGTPLIRGIFQHVPPLIITLTAGSTAMTIRAAWKSLPAGSVVVNPLDNCVVRRRLIPSVCILVPAGTFLCRAQSSYFQVRQKRP